MIDVLLIQPPIRDFYLTAKRTIPYGLASIAGELRKAGFSVRILDCLATSKSQIIELPEEMSYLRAYYGLPDVSPFALFHHFKHFGFSFQHLAQILGQMNSFLVGISSLFTAYSEEAVETARVVRRCLPHCKIVLGGHHPTAMPEEVLKHPEIDYVIRGEGEQAMAQLAKALRYGKEIRSIPGIVLRDSSTTISINDPATVSSLDSLALPALDLIEHGFYQRKSKGSAVVCTSRGCPLRCSYCSLGASYISYRKRSVPAVLEEIDGALSKYGAGFIDFEDENISIDKKWFLELLKGLIKRTHGKDLELRAMNGLLPSTLDEEVIEAMAAAGFKILNLSLGSTSASQLQRFSRPNVTETFDKALSSADKNALQAVGYIIVGAPQQNPYDSLQDLLFLAERRVLAGVSVYYPSPGSADFVKCAQMKILPPTFGLMRATAIPISDATSRDDAVTLLRLGRLLNFIKSLRDEGRQMPGPSNIEAADLKVLRNKREIGVKLLEGFLQDGKIRGVTPDADVFEHQISESLAVKFRDALLKIEVKGTRL